MLPNILCIFFFCLLQLAGKRWGGQFFGFHFLTPPGPAFSQLRKQALRGVVISSLFLGLTRIQCVHVSEPLTHLPHLEKNQVLFPRGQPLLPIHGNLAQFQVMLTKGDGVWDSTFQQSFILSPSLSTCPTRLLFSQIVTNPVDPHIDFQSAR